MATYKCRFCSDVFESSCEGYVWCYACNGVGDGSDRIDHHDPDAGAPPQLGFALEPIGA
jgi:hypothetical protein